MAEFDGGALTSDAGGLLLGAAANAKRSAVERGEGSGSTRRARVSFNPARRQPPAAVSASANRLMSCGSSNEGLLCRGEVGPARRFNHRETASP